MEPHEKEQVAFELSLEAMHGFSSQINVFLGKMDDVVSGHYLEVISLRASFREISSFVDQCIHFLSDSNPLNKIFWQFWDPFKANYCALISLLPKVRKAPNKYISQLREICKKIKFFVHDFGMHNLAQVKAKYDKFITISSEDFFERKGDDFVGPYFVPPGPDIHELIPDLYLEQEEERETDLSVNDIVDEEYEEVVEKRVPLPALSSQACVLGPMEIDKAFVKFVDHMDQLEEDRKTDFELYQEGKNCSPEVSGDPTKAERLWGEQQIKHYYKRMGKQVKGNV